jgi:hypothetical protein
MEKQLEAFVAAVVQAHRNGVSISVLRAQLILNGMDGEETSLLLDIVAIEVRKSPTVQPGQIIDTYV